MQITRIIIIIQNILQIMHQNHFNNYLNNLFQKIPTFYKLITALKKEEVLSYNDYDRRIRGFLLRKIKTINRTDEIKVLIERYINKEEKLIFIECDDDDIVELWYDCLIYLNNIKY